MSTYFPQLTTGSMAQYPVKRQWTKAAIINTLPDGSSITMADPTPPRVSWELCYQGLSSSEWNALQALFITSQGRFRTFSFLDPTDNLLSWTEDFTASVWTADPLLTIVEGMADPLGNSAAAKLTNGAQTAQQLTQALACPTWFQYCLSVYLRADAPCTVFLVQSSSNTEARQACALSGTWTRAIVSAMLGGLDEQVRFGVEIPASASISIFGPQVEAQFAAGLYKPKAGWPGIYSKSRFDQDILVQTTDTNGQSSTTIQIAASY